MSFRIKKPNLTDKVEVVSTKKEYTQEEIDLIEAKFKVKDKIFDNFVNKPANPLISQYRKNLDSSPKFEKETLKYDSSTGKWFIEKESKT